MLELLKEYNEPFIKNCSHGDEEKTDIFQYTDFNSKLILTAPHSTRSFCNKKKRLLIYIQEQL